MKTLIFMIIAAVFCTSGAFATDTTWTGKISDSMCGADHSKMAAEHGGANAKTSDRDCTLACVKGGGKYVFVNDDKIYTISNQDFEGLEKHAGHTVSLTGEMKGDSISVSKIVMPKE